MGRTNQVADGGTHYRGSPLPFADWMDALRKAHPEHPAWKEYDDLRRGESMAQQYFQHNLRLAAEVVAAEKALREVAALPESLHWSRPVSIALAGLEEMEALRAVASAAKAIPEEIDPLPDTPERTAKRNALREENQ